MVTFDVNIGLAYPAGVHAPAVAKNALSASFPLGVLGYTDVRRSDTEDTLVATVATVGTFDDVFTALHALAVTLEQDCIAVKFGDRGVLVGPIPWGAFNPDYFLNP